MSTLRKIIDSIDGTDEKAAEIRDNLKVLTELAESKATIFEDEIQLNLKTGKTTDDLTVPITKVIKKSCHYRATTSSKTSDVLQEVTIAIQDMISDSSASGIVSGVAKIATSALNTIMGVGEGEEQTVKLYSVVTDYPAIVRFDFAFWCRKISAKSLKEYCENTLACVAYKSAVDVTKLAFNDFLALYGPVLNEGLGSDPAKMKEMIQQAKEVYKMYTGEDSAINQLNLSDNHSWLQNCLSIVGNNTKQNGIIVSPAQRATVGNF